MESQPLASTDQADAETQAQCMATDGDNTRAPTAHCTVATGDGEGIQAVPESSSPSVTHEQAQIQHSATGDLTQLQEGPVLHSDREEGLLVATGASPDKGFVSEAVCVSEAECVEDVAEVADSQDGSLAAGPPDDDEAEVCPGMITCMLYPVHACVFVLLQPFRLAKSVHVLLAS